jgi:hypothetical protein
MTTAETIVRSTIKRLKIRSRGGRGGRLSTSPSLGSKAKREGKPDENHFRSARRDEQVNHFANVVVGYAAFFDAGNDRGEVVVADHQFRGFAGNVRPRSSHSNPDVGSAQCGCIVHPVARHGNEVACTRCGIHELQLLMGRNTREYAALANRFR